MLNDSNLKKKNTITQGNLNPSMFSTATVLAREAHGKIALQKSKTINSKKSPSPQHNKQSYFGGDRSGPDSLNKMKEDTEGRDKQEISAWKDAEMQQTRNYFYMTNKNFDDIRNKTMYPPE